MTRDVMLCVKSLNPSAPKARIRCREGVGSCTPNVSTFELMMLVYRYRYVETMPGYVDDISLKL